MWRLSDRAVSTHPIHTIEEVPVDGIYNFAVKSMCLNSKPHPDYIRRHIFHFNPEVFLPLKALSIKALIGIFFLNKRMLQG